MQTPAPTSPPPTTTSSGDAHDHVLCENSDRKIWESDSTSSTSAASLRTSPAWTKFIAKDLAHKGGEAVLYAQARHLRDVWRQKSLQWQERGQEWEQGRARGQRKDPSELEQTEWEDRFGRRLSVDQGELADHHPSGHSLRKRGMGRQIHPYTRLCGPMGTRTGRLLDIAYEETDIMGR